ncbi:hypothetical protein BGZ63DRAFT_379568 [Mariannaea sp. PMI_226]|nr:hypothetical protein BGZ63DRAFT_379568 [Mariannaea sp. PMI_226]
MDPTVVYAIAFCAASLVIFMVAHLGPHLRHLAVYVWVCLLRNLCYRYAIRRHTWIGPYTILSVLVHIIYVSGNVICLCYNGRSVSFTFASRAAVLSLINLGPVFLAIHLGFLADFFGVSLTTYRQVHRTCSLVSASLLFTHVIAVTVRPRTASLDTWSLRFAIVGTSALGLLVVLSALPLRRHSYELFLRLHQFLAIVFAASIIYHIFSVSDMYRLPAYIYGAICGFLMLAQAAIVLYRNKALGKLCPRIVVRRDNGSLQATVYLPRPVRVDAGQYINLWVPSQALLSSHPFTVISWSPIAQDSLELLIEPRHGFTSKLLQLSNYGQNQYLAFISGPHGITVPVLEFKTVVLVASDFGLTSILPYIKKLFNDNALGNRLRRRVHLVWHLEHKDYLGLMLLVKPLIDDVLENAEQNEYNLCISIYCQHWPETQTFGDHERLFILKRAPDLGKIIQEEHDRHYNIGRVKRRVHFSDDTAADEAAVANLPLRDTKLVGDVQRQIRRAEGSGLVLVSGTGVMRDTLRDTIRGYVGSGFALRELEYQPE